jgi:2-phospho-L-lactate/phosphoenolpyruvate guanylyltransferase
MILVPVKNLSGAKQRLAAILDQAARTELAQAMLSDVLETLARLPQGFEVGIVTSDPFAIRLAQQFHFIVIPDNLHRSETDAIEIATRYCEEQGVDSTLVIPGDIPLIQSWEVEGILRVAPAEGSVLVPAADGRGTNAIFRRPASLFPARFGDDSFKPHHAAAQATGKPCIVLTLPGIALDIDSPSDLRQLAAIPGETRAQRLVRQWQLGELPLADFPLAANE